MFFTGTTEHCASEISDMEVALNKNPVITHIKAILGLKNTQKKN